ncbi:marvel domain-containing protein [Apiosordaria backusii]|uniref:Marvel domain-containing protein n=1 Tax=Apiosordaria backusii TaxID=314023 RepID=A0AA40K4A2_9PEZI|nr:marvel domain-containing protein [Apiosordaria backusii]
MQKTPLYLRSAQLLFILITTALIGNVIATNISAASSATAAINFTMFVLVLTWLAALFGLVSTIVERIAYPVGLLALDAASTLFAFIAAVVLAAKLTVVNCADTSGKAGDWIAYGSADDTKRCRQIQASTVFMWFLFTLFTTGLVLSLMGFRRGGGSVRTGPTMSQIGV